MSNPCTDRLTDLEYLEHMIPHHQVAIDMSNLLIPKTNNPTILHLCRDIIRKQDYEIWEMKMAMKRLVESAFTDDKSILPCESTKLDFYEPIKSKDKNGECDPLFFKPNDHMAHMAHMKVNDRSYLEHMIPHHQVAVDMSKRLLLHTTNSYLINFCKKLIIDQQYEILKMNQLLESPMANKNNLFYKSRIL